MMNGNASQSLPTDACAELGVSFPCERMANGECRFRCMDQGGFGYILTKMPPHIAGWQNSHYHKNSLETYIVQSGWICFATLGSGKVSLAIYGAGDTVTTAVNQAHNLYMSAGTVTHTVKHGDTSAELDWFASVELDTATKQLSERDILESVAL